MGGGKGGEGEGSGRLGGELGGGGEGDHQAPHFDADGAVRFRRQLRVRALVADVVAAEVEDHALDPRLAEAQQRRAPLRQGVQGPGGLYG